MADRYESRASTHAEGCWAWGPGHYGCAVGEIERLREMLQRAFQRGYQSGQRGLREMYDAVQAVKRQDAWGNTQLTEALLAAEDRAEKAEAERSALLAERDALRVALEDELNWHEAQDKAISKQPNANTGHTWWRRMQHQEHAVVIRAALGQGQGGSDDT